ncbi:MAG TPA: archease [Chloroflexi bacterium]|nr:archease [Chloroflexota bacterium]
MTTMAAPFEEVEHVADAAIRVQGADWAELLVNAAVGMFSLMADWENPPLSRQQEISLHSMDRETLLVDWLSELLYLFEMEEAVYLDFDILEVSPTSIKAIARGTEEWAPRTAIKAVTFNDLRIAETPQGYAATIVFDT